LPRASGADGLDEVVEADGDEPVAELEAAAAVQSPVRGWSRP